MHIQSLVGYTESNKPIYQYDISDPKELVEKIAGISQEDHFDAAAVFSYLQLVYWRKYGEDSLDFRSVTNMLYVHTTSMTGEFNKTYAMRLGIITAFDRAHYGRQHCVPYLQQLLDT